MPKGQAPKVKGAICNVPNDIVDTCNSLPRPADSNGLVLVKLKRKIEYKGHVYFEAVRPHFVNQLLNFLKQENHLYNDIEINTENIPCNLIDFMGPDLDDGIIISKYLIAHQEIPLPLELELDDDIDFNNENSTHTTDMLEQNENPLDMHRAAVRNCSNFK